MQFGNDSLSKVNILNVESMVTNICVWIYAQFSKEGMLLYCWNNLDIWETIMQFQASRYLLRNKMKNVIKKKTKKCACRLSLLRTTRWNGSFCVLEVVICMLWRKWKPRMRFFSTFFWSIKETKRVESSMNIVKEKVSSLTDGSFHHLTQLLEA